MNIIQSKYEKIGKRMRWVETPEIIKFNLLSKGKEPNDEVARWSSEQNECWRKYSGRFTWISCNSNDTVSKEGKLNRSVVSENHLCIDSLAFWLVMAFLYFCIVYRNLMFSCSHQITRAQKFVVFFLNSLFFGPCCEFFKLANIVMIFAVALVVKNIKTTEKLHVCMFNRKKS